VVVGWFKSRPALLPHVRKGIRAARIAADPLGYLRRRRLARDLARGAEHADFVPQDAAWRFAPPDTFPAIAKALPAAEALYREHLAGCALAGAAPDTYAYLLNDAAGIADLARHPEFLELALSRPFVEAAAGYLGEVPILGGVTFQAVQPNDRTQGFQLFHIDRVASRQLKIFIPVHDVDEDSGATMIVPADVTARIVAEHGQPSGRIADGVVMSDRYRPHIRHAAGAAGSAFFFDTCRTIHCGARTRSRPRLLIMLQYVSKYGYVETDLQLGRMRFDRAAVAGDPLARLLLNID